MESQGFVKNKMRMNKIQMSCNSNAIMNIDNNKQSFALASCVHKNRKKEKNQVR